MQYNVIVTPNSKPGQPKIYDNKGQVLVPGSGLPRHKNPKTDFYVISNPNVTHDRRFIIVVKDHGGDYITSNVYEVVGDKFPFDINDSFPEDLVRVFMSDDPKDESSKGVGLTKCLDYLDSL